MTASALDPAAIRRLTSLLRIAHHIPGRVRLKLNVAAVGEMTEIITVAKNFGRSFENAPGIRSVSVNPAALSCVVEYDPGRIPPAEWEALVKGAPSMVAALLAGAAA